MGENLPPLPQKGLKERLYDKIPLSVRALDVMIVILFLALAVTLFMGTR